MVKRQRHGPKGDAAAGAGGGELHSGERRRRTAESRLGPLGHLERDVVRPDARHVPAQRHGEAAPEPEGGPARLGARGPDDVGDGDGRPRHLLPVPDELDGREEEGVGAAGEPAAGQKFVEADVFAGPLGGEEISGESIDTEHDRLVRALRQHRPQQAFVQRGGALARDCAPGAVDGTSVLARRRRLEPRAHGVERVADEDGSDPAARPRDDMTRRLALHLDERVASL
mmetsp:Transcript_7240/g.23596  ORF Transcript_7240/g.23596 Transcript_7240/m.23596 type:complete len:228 (-) Transcript_7240:41-724(-)